jgi:hypothetical protein
MRMYIQDIKDRLSAGFNNVHSDLQDKTVIT